MQKVQDSSYDLEQKRGRKIRSKSYEEVRKLIASNQFKNMREYREWVTLMKAKGLAEDIPLNAYIVYTNRGEWISRDHFLGITERILNENKPILSENRVPKQSYTGIRAIIRQILGMNREKLSV